MKKRFGIYELIEAVEPLTDNLKWHNWCDTLEEAETEVQRLINKKSTAYTILTVYHKN